MMNDPAVVPFAAVEHLAFGITIADDGHEHCGFICRIDNDEPAWVHLAWHVKLMSELPPDGVYWADPASLMAAEKRVLSLNIRKITERKQPIPYALSHVGLRFDEEGKLTGIMPGLGFTCSTFMVQVLASYGHDLLQEATWPLNANLAFQLQTLENLKHPKAMAHPMHIAGVEKSVGGRRVTPSEVLGAASFDDIPMDFTNAQAAAKKVVAEVARLKRAAAARKAG